MLLSKPPVSQTPHPATTKKPVRTVQFMTWPPADTDRNRLVYGVGAVVGVLATVYCLLFALQTGALIPWTFFTLWLAATLLAGLGLLLMREQRQAAEKAEPAEAGSSSGGRPVGE